MKSLPRSYFDIPMLSLLCLMGFLVPLLCSQFFQDHYTVIKWHYVHLTSLLLGTLLFLRGNLRLPKLKLWQFGLVCMLLGLSIVNIYVRGADFGMALLDRLSFIILFLASFQLFVKEGLKRLHLFFLFLFAATYLLHIYSVLQMFGFDLYPEIVNPKHASFFGNANMLAQFLGFSTFFQCYYLLQKRDQLKAARAYIPLLLLLSLSFAMLIYLGCRSILLGLAVALPFLVYSFRHRILKKELVAVLVGTLIFSIPISFSKNMGGGVLSKTTDQIEGTHIGKNSLGVRLSLWKDSFELLSDRPFGLGTGNFEFNLIPYMIDSEVKPNEDIVYNTPHNELVRYLVEDGMAYTLLFGILFLFLISSVIRKRKEHADKFVLVTGFWLLFGVEAFFQFPLMNAIGLSLFTVMLAYTWSLLPQIEVPNNFLLRPLFALCTLAIIALSSLNLRATYTIANHYKNKLRLGVACTTFPVRWRACMLYSQMAMIKGEYRTSFEAAHSILKRNPNQFVAIKLLMMVSFKQNNKPLGCYYAWKYDQIFSGKSKYHPVVKRACPRQLIDKFEQKNKLANL